jgi:hypothetical protein
MTRTKLTSSEVSESLPSSHSSSVCSSRASSAFVAEAEGAQPDWREWWVGESHELVPQEVRLELAADDSVRWRVTPKPPPAMPLTPQPHHHYTHHQAQHQPQPSEGVGAKEKVGEKEEGFGEQLLRSLTPMVFSSPDPDPSPPPPPFSPFCPPYF